MPIKTKLPYRLALLTGEMLHYIHVEACLWRRSVWAFEVSICE